MFVKLFQKNSKMNNPYIIGKTIYLRAPEKKDLDGKWHEWLSDPNITQYFADRSWPNTKQRQKAFYRPDLHI